MKYFTLGLLLALSSSLIAQVPQAFQYQAVARDANGACISDAFIRLRISIIDDSAATNPIFEEVFIDVQTNEQGLFSIEIGTGTPQAGSPGFADLNWNQNGQSRHLKVEMSPDNSPNFLEVGMSRLLAVPYAQAAGNGLMYNAVSNDEFLPWHGPNGERNGVLGGMTDGSGHNRGILSLYNENGETRVWQGFGSDGDGAATYYGSNGERSVVIGSRGVNPNEDNFGEVTLRNDADQVRVDASVNPTAGSGQLVLFGDNGSPNVVLGISSNAAPNDGAQTIRNVNGVMRVSFGILNDLGVKNFVMDHPTQAGKQIWYACIEGPEAAAYERGTAELVNGEAEITFSEHFEIVANPETMTVLTSPRSPDSKGLATFEYTATGFKVKELHGGTGSYQFDWEVKAVRKGLEDYEVIRDKMPELDAGIDMEDR